MGNVFAHKHGSQLLTQPFPIMALVCAVVVFGFLIAFGGFTVGLGLIVLPFIFAYVYFIFLSPKIGIVGLYILNYIVLGTLRYIKGVPLGLAIDGHLILLYLALFFKSFFHKVEWGNAKNDLVLLSAIWFGYAMFQLVNPEAVSRVAWFYAMRGVALYMILTIPIIFILCNTKKDLDIFLKIWAVMSLLATFKGIMQKFMGPDPWEQAWLDGGGSLTHILFGKLRVFSFMSDAGQFGAAQGQTGVVFTILALNQKKSFKLKLFYGFVGLMGFYGMLISGTRGAIAVPVMGFALYVALQKNIKILILGAILGLSVFVFFKYTTIGSGNYSINRMRTAFDPNDASLLVRLENQRKLKSYMAARPFGGGIGSAGNWGMRFTPNTFLANTPTDSWFVAIWAEQGIVGLTLHLFILFYIVFKSSYKIAFVLKDDWTKAKMSALVSGLIGIMAASYGNGVFGQMPTGIILYTSMGYLFLSEKLDAEAVAENNKQAMLVSETNLKSIPNE
jgi:hypothetical protein